MPYCRKFFVLGLAGWTWAGWSGPGWGAVDQANSLARAFASTLEVVDGLDGSVSAIGELSGSAPASYNLEVGDVPLDVGIGVPGDFDLLRASGEIIALAGSTVDGSTAFHVTTGSVTVSDLSLVIADPAGAPPPALRIQCVFLSSDSEASGDQGSLTSLGTSSVDELIIEVNGSPVTVGFGSSPPPNTIIDLTSAGLAGATLRFNAQSSFIATDAASVETTALVIIFDNVSVGSRVLDGEVVVGRTSAAQAVDTDGDSVPNALDLDDDGDGVPDTVETGGAGTGDADNDGVPNDRDLDSDDDGLNDVLEAGGIDVNGNGMHDGAADINENGLADTVDPAAGGTALPDPDFDGDGARNRVDVDSDNDSRSDLIEGGNGALDATDDGLADGVDGDGDGIPSSADGFIEFGDANSPPLPNTDAADRPDYLDADSDNDGILDLAGTGSEPFDLDLDGRIDFTADADADGIDDRADSDDVRFGGLSRPTPDDDLDGLSNEVEGDGLVDTDGDSVPDSQDADSDGDGIPDRDDRAGGLAHPDTDGDGVADWRDLDSDNDGINDVLEAGGVDVNGDARQDGGGDADGDGWIDSADPNAGGTGLVVPDSEGDGARDFVDVDSDNDGRSDLVESGHGTADGNGDGLADSADPEPDADADGIPDSVDGADTFGDAASPAPTDTDGIAPPDYLDADSDGDGTLDIVGTAAEPFDVNGDGQIDFGTDADRDGIDARVDANDAVFGGLAPVDADTDDDDDGLSNAVEGNGTVDTDGDSQPDSQDLDSDADGLTDAAEALIAPPTGDTDGDGASDWRDLDDDNDGINTVLEAGGTDANRDGRHDGTDGNANGLVASVDPSEGGQAVPAADADGDGRPDFVDLDSDNDTVVDLIESGGGRIDADFDGLVDGGDSDSDGIVDGADSLTGFGDSGDRPPVNTDAVDAPDFLDADSDNLGGSDIEAVGRAALDIDGDGRVDDPIADPDADGIDNRVDDDDNSFGGSGSCLASGAQWRAMHFTVLERADPAVSGWNADADNDGVSNAFEYAAGSDPRNPSSRATLTVRSIPGPQSLEVTVPKSTCARAFLFVEFSSDLDSWTREPEGGVTFDESGTQLSARAAPASGSSQPALFGRVRILVP